MSSLPIHTARIAVLALLIAPAGADLAPQPRMEFSQGLQGTFNADWEGVPGRTYFMQFSMDLQTWHYAPFIHFGKGVQRRGITADASTYVLRLHYGDFPEITTLEEAMTEDLDGDGLSNIFEVTFGYDPFEPESTSDGPDASLDPDGDGLGNESEQAMGSNPMAKDHPAVYLRVDFN